MHTLSIHEQEDSMFVYSQLCPLVMTRKGMGWSVCLLEQQVDRQKVFGIWFASVASQFFHKFSRWIGLCSLLSCLIVSTFLPAIFSCASHILMFTPPCPSRQFLVIWTHGSIHLFVGLCSHTDFCTSFHFCERTSQIVLWLTWWTWSLVLFDSGDWWPSNFTFQLVSHKSIVTSCGFLSILKYFNPGALKWWKRSFLFFSCWKLGFM